jgi:hypothetical protein
LDVKKATQKRATFYANTLSAEFDDVVILRVLDDLMRTWEERRLPVVAVISRLCRSAAGSNDTEVDEVKTERADEHKVWMQRKFRYRDGLKEVTHKLKTSQPLNSIQAKAVKEVTKYMVVTFGNRWLQKLDYKGEKQPLNPVTASFAGLYMDQLSGRLAPLKGEPRGDIKAELPF